MSSKPQVLFHNFHTLYDKKSNLAEEEKNHMNEEQREIKDKRDS